MTLVDSTLSLISLPKHRAHLCPGSIRIANCRIVPDVVLGELGCLANRVSLPRPNGSLISGLAAVITTLTICSCPRPYKHLACGAPYGQAVPVQGGIVFTYREGQQ